MALFQFADHALPYEIHFAPFTFDLVLLQSSRFDTGFWGGVVENLTGGSVSGGGGRVLTLDWKVSGLSDEDLAVYFARLLATLGMSGARVVAFDDGVRLAQAVEKLNPGTFTQTLFFAVGGPKAEPLEKEVREFCGI